MLQTWATVTMLKEAPEVVLDFVAHHVCMGASEVFLYFDDPEDPAIPLVEKVPQVRAIRCTPDHWAAIGARLPTHEARQKANANHARERTACDWIIHLDADEMVHADGRVSDLLHEADTDVLRLAPFEAFHLPRAGQGERPEFRFRGVLPRGPRGDRLGAAAYGAFAGLLGQGMLSHAAGKFFVRTDDPAVRMSIHGPFRNGVRAPAGEAAGMRLLHFHSSDWNKWRRHLEFRLQKGAYAAHWQPRKARAAEQETLFAALERLRNDEGEEGLRRFYHLVCTFGPEKRVLARAGALFEADLWLADKRKAVFDQTLTPAETWPFEVRRLWRGLSVLLTPDVFPMERLQARAIGWPEAAADYLLAALSGKPLLMADFGPGQGLFCLLAARAAQPGSTVMAIDPVDAHHDRLLRASALNGVTIQVAVEFAEPARSPEPDMFVVAHVDADRADCIGPFMDWSAKRQPDLVILSGAASCRTKLADDLHTRGHTTAVDDETTTTLTRQSKIRT